MMVGGGVINDNANLYVRWFSIVQPVTDICYVSLHPSDVRSDLSECLAPRSLASSSNRMEAEETLNLNGKQGRTYLLYRQTHEDT